jgi:hypothetical protein
MTLEELKSLTLGEVVKFTRIDKSVNLYNEYNVGDQLHFLEYNEFTNYYNFVRIGSGPPVICHFGFGIHPYIERKVVLEREKKIKSLLG